MKAPVLMRYVGGAGTLGERLEWIVHGREPGQETGRGTRVGEDRGRLTREVEIDYSEMM